MNFRHVTQIETEEQSLPPVDAEVLPFPEPEQAKRKLGIFKLGRILAGSAFKGVIISVILGAVSGLAIGLFGTIKGIDLDTLIVVGVAAGYVSGVIAMIAVIISGVRQAKRQKGELV
jgi:hypothetical protein